MALLKWKASKCLKFSVGCRGLAGKGKEVSRGLGALEVGLVAGGRRVGFDMGSYRVFFYFCSRIRG